jgi:pimeloyl-ACP methyl ester carboxylesterase
MAAKTQAGNDGSLIRQSKSIVFIHGLFQNPQSWTPWKKFFEERGYTCYTPAYPYHEGEPAALRQHINPALGKLTLTAVLDSLEKFIDALPEKPILIGHSMGGLLAQLLIARQKAVAAVCIDAAPPKGIFSFKWSFLKANLATINPFKGNSVCLPSVEWFHYAFCNTMSLEETQAAYTSYVVPESRNIPRNSTSKAGKIDFKKAHEPLLFIAGEKDNIIPPSLNKKNFEAYKDKGSATAFKEFPGRTHYICGQDGWLEVATYILNWIEKP